MEHRDEELSAHIAAEGSPAGASSEVQPGMGSSGEQVDHPVPDELAVAEQVERREQDEQESC